MSKLLDVCISINIFSIVVHVFPNLFWKICPLFGHILLTCLKCSRSSFFPPSYSEKMRWDEVGFPVNFVKFLRTSFLIKHLQWLFLYDVAGRSILISVIFYLSHRGHKRFILPSTFFTHVIINATPHRTSNHIYFHMNR